LDIKTTFFFSFWQDNFTGYSYFSVAVAKMLDRNNLSEERFILLMALEGSVHSSRPRASWRQDQVEEEAVYLRRGEAERDRKWSVTHYPQGPTSSDLLLPVLSHLLKCAETSPHRGTSWKLSSQNISLLRGE
jgi:hypothetical protein